MLTRSLPELTEGSIVALIENRVSESRTLDFKRDLYGRSEANKRSLLADISAMANTLGGDIVIGVEEADGVAAVCCGVDLESEDQFVLWVQEVLDAGLDPRLVPRVSCRAVPLQSGRKVVVIRVPRSVSGPHRVAETSRFYGRHERGNFICDTAQIRDAMLSGQGRAAAIRRFRIERCAAIRSGEVPVPLIGTRHVVLHLLPLYSLERQPVMDTKGLAELAMKVPVLAQEGGINHRPTLEGFSISWGSQDEGGPGYVQVFRNGMMEVVVDHPFDMGDRFPNAFSSCYEVEMARVLPRWVECFDVMRISDPIVLMLSLLNVRGMVPYAETARRVTMRVHLACSPKSGPG